MFRINRTVSPDKRNKFTKFSTKCSENPLF
nr:MAG TPA: hypothetical protein [Caudoviricetes sp.]